jgi:hypothetical protein
VWKYSTRGCGEFPVGYWKNSSRGVGEYLPHYREINEELWENNFILKKRIFEDFAEYSSIISIDS